MLLVYYPSKKDMKENHIGQPLKYDETSMFGPEYTPNGTVTISNRPSITGVKGREFFAQVTMKNGVIAKVS